MFSHAYRMKFLSLGVLFLLLSFPSHIYAATSLNDYPKIKNLWNDGELVIAIDKLKDMAKNKPKDDEIFELLKKVTFQKSKLDKWINKGKSLLKQEKFEEAKSILDFAKAISPNYKPYVALMDELKTTQDALKYPSKMIFNGESLDSSWKPYEYYAKFSSYSTFDNSSLLLNVPAGHGWAHIGIESNDTIIDLNETNQSTTHQLKFKFDPKNTTGFAIDLQGVNLDKSNTYNGLQIFYKKIDDNSSILELYKDRRLNTKLDMGSVAPESMELIIQPNNMMYLHLPEGKFLQTTSIKFPMPTKGYKLKVYSKPKAKNLASKMALKSIELREIPFEKKKVKTVIFDGKYLEDVWKPYEAYEHFFAEFSRFKNNALMINVPEKMNLGQVGIESSDTIIDLTDINQLLAYHLKFKFDSKDTTGFAIDLDGENFDKSHSYNRYQILYKKIDDNSSILELYKDGGLHTKLDMESVAPDSMELIVQPNNMMYLHLPDGRYLQTTSIKYPMPTKGYRVRVYSKPKARHLASKMSLKSIELKKLPFKKSFDPSNLGKQEGKIVLFDGKYLEDKWIPYSEQYMDYFRQYAVFDDNKLIIDIPKNNKWGEAGILSPEPLVWLDRLGKDGEIKTTFTFDPIATTGFTIAAGDINNFWKQPAGSYLTLSWAKVEDENISKLRFKIRNTLLLDQNLTGQAPSTLTLSFRSGEIGIEGDTFSKKTFEWPHLVENRALHLWAYSHAYKKNLPVKMALRKIVLDRKFGEPVPPAKPAKGVAILPEKEIYSSNTIEKWECHQRPIKGKENDCSLSPASLFIAVKNGEKSTFRMKSKEKIIHLDTRRIKETPLKMVMYFTPKKTDHFYIDLGNHHVSLEKKDQNTYVFKWDKYWSRNVDAKWLENDWNGRVNITMSKKWTEAELDGGVSINRPDYVGAKGYLIVSLAPLNVKMQNNASLELKKITMQWLAPDGMTAVDRWNFVNDEDFDPDKFLEELRMENNE